MTWFKCQDLVEWVLEWCYALPWITCPVTKLGMLVALLNPGVTQAASLSYSWRMLDGIPWPAPGSCRRPAEIIMCQNSILLDLPNAWQERHQVRISARWSSPHRGLKGPWIHCHCSCSVPVWAWETPAHCKGYPSCVLSQRAKHSLLVGCLLVSPGV